MAQQIETRDGQKRGLAPQFFDWRPAKPAPAPRGLPSGWTGEYLLQIGADQLVAPARQPETAESKPNDFFELPDVIKGVARRQRRLAAQMTSSKVLPEAADYTLHVDPAKEAEERVLAIRTQEEIATYLDGDASTSSYAYPSEKADARIQFTRGLHGALDRKRENGGRAQRKQSQYRVSQGDKGFTKIVSGTEVVSLRKPNGELTGTSAANKRRFEEQFLREQHESGLEEYSLQQEPTDTDSKTTSGDDTTEAVVFDSARQAFEEFVAEEEALLQRNGEDYDDFRYSAWDPEFGRTPEESSEIEREYSKRDPVTEIDPKVLVFLGRK